MQVRYRKTVEEDRGDHADDAPENYPTSSHLVSGKIFCAEKDTAVEHVTSNRLHDSSQHSKEHTSLSRVAQSIDDERGELCQVSKAIT